MLCPVLVDQLVFATLVISCACAFCESTFAGLSCCPTYSYSLGKTDN